MIDTDPYVLATLDSSGNASTPNKADFDKFIDQIRKIKPLAADYIMEIPHNQWATCACDVHRSDKSLQT